MTLRYKIIAAALLCVPGLTRAAGESLSFISEIPAVVPVGQQFQVLGRVINESDKEIDGYSLTLRVDGEDYVLERPRLLMPGASADVTWRCDFIPSAPGDISYSVGLKSDGSEESFTEGKAFVRQRRWVVEERTGTWCSNCPWGIYVFEQMHEKFGDEFIGIALHTYGNDPMGTPDYQLSYFSTDESAPYTMINRTRGCHPVNLEEEMEKMARQTLLGSIEEANAAYNPATGEVTASASFMFAYDRIPTEAPYRVGYFIIENDVHDDSPAYSQQNAFSGGTTLPGWGELPKVIPGSEMWYQHVGRGFSSNIYGIEESVPEKVIAGEIYSYEETFRLPENVMNPANCRLVIMLLDTRSKAVLNGLELSLDGSYSGMVIPVTETEDIAFYYTLSGQRLAGFPAASGVYVEIKGGKARKIAVR